MEIEKQIELLKKYGVSNYTVENSKITINGDLNLPSLTTCDKDFLKDTTINGFLNLDSLTTCDKDFLKDTTINGCLYLDSLTTCDKDFLKDTTINGFLNLRGLTTCDKDFLKDTTINGDLNLPSLTTCDKDFLKDTTINGFLNLRGLTTCRKDIIRRNVKTLKKGYNKEKGYCFFDGILSKVLNVSCKKGYTIYTTPFDFIAQKGDFTAHGKTVKKAIQDVEFKIVAEKLKKEPIKKDTLFTVKYYRLITGACDSGCRDFMQKNHIPFKITDDGDTIELKPMKAADLLPILEENNAYGVDKFKELIEW